MNSAQMSSSIPHPIYLAGYTNLLLQQEMGTTALHGILPDYGNHGKD